MEDPAYDYVAFCLYNIKKKKLPLKKKPPKDRYRSDLKITDFQWVSKERKDLSLYEWI